MITLSPKSMSQQLNAALGNRPPDRIWLTTFTVDEGELWRMACDLCVLGTDRLTVRYDPAGYRPYADRAILGRSVLNPFQVAIPKAQKIGRSPAIYHPKICLAEVGKTACLIVSTANLAHDDQRCASNIQCLLPLRAQSSCIVKQWIMSPGKKRTLCAISRAGERQPKVVSTHQSMWEIFNHLRAESACDREEWELASPFWSTTMLSMLRGTGRVRAFFRDRHQAQAVASSVADTWLSCHAAPEHKPFHHKVLLWRGKHGKKSRTILYIGSANLTRSGFIGIRMGFAHNWEVGCFFVGGDDLWDLGRAAVRAGIDGWRPIHIRPGGPARHADVGPDSEEDVEGMLRVHLSRVIQTKGRTVIRLSSPPPPGFDLRRVELVTGRTHRSLSAERPTRCPTAPNSVTVEAIYRRAHDGRCFPVSLALPLLCADPPISRQDATVLHLRAILRRGASGADTSSSQGCEVTQDVSEVRSSGDDIRFPFQDLIACQAERPNDAKAWLHHVVKLRDEVPPSWRIVANHLLAHET